VFNVTNSHLFSQQELAPGIGKEPVLLPIAFDVSGDPDAIEPHFQGTTRGTGKNGAFCNAVFVHAVTLVAVSIQGSFMDTAFYMHLSIPNRRADISLWVILVKWGSGFRMRSDS
jgi:hypothetical protein